MQEKLKEFMDILNEQVGVRLHSILVYNYKKKTQKWLIKRVKALAENYSDKGFVNLTRNKKMQFH